jgi:rare lipoprotein A
MTWGIWLTAGFVFACSLASGQASAEDAKKFSGLATYYSKDYEGKLTSGETYDPKKFTAAHRTLPFGTRVRVTDAKTKRSVEVVVNDRGPFNEGYVIDLSLAAAKELGMIEHGKTEVKAAVQ